MLIFLSLDHMLPPWDHSPLFTHFHQLNTRSPRCTRSYIPWLECWKKYNPPLLRTFSSMSQSPSLALCELLSWTVLLVLRMTSLSLLQIQSCIPQCLSSPKLWHPSQPCGQTSLVQLDFVHSTRSPSFFSRLVVGVLSVYSPIKIEPLGILPEIIHGFLGFYASFRINHL